MTAPSVADMLSLYRTGAPTIGVIGLGYVGLPLSLAYVAGKVKVLGFDIDESKCADIAEGRSYLSTVKSSEVQHAVTSKLFSATTNFARLAECDAILICVPTPLGDARSPDLKYVRMTAEAISRTLRPGQLIVLESTTWPGTTDEVVRDILDRTGLVSGKDYWLAFSPEREDPGNPNFTTAQIPKVVGGTDAASGDLAEAAYQRAFKRVVRVSSAQVAESAKLLENIYRAVNIALVNELKVVFDRMGIDVWEVIEAASTKPFGYQPFYPGPGLGGHCIPIDPFYLTWRAASFGVNTRFIELAGEINSAMPDYVVHRCQDALNDHQKSLKGSNILMLGVAYKGGVSDTRESPGIELFHMLQAKGANVTFHDPLVPMLESTRKHELDIHGVNLTLEVLAKADLVLLTIVQPGMDLKLVAENARLIVDTRNAFKDFPNAPVVKA